MEFEGTRVGQGILDPKGRYKKGGPNGPPFFSKVVMLESVDQPGGEDPGIIWLDVFKVN